MAFNSMLDGRSWKSWEQDPSTRESLRLFIKSKPIDVTLTTPGTAQDLISVSPGVATVNLVTNPACETSDPPTGYTAVRSAALAQNAVYYQYGANSLEITPPNAARGEGAYWNLGSIPNTVPLSCSAYFRRGGAGSGNVRIELVASSVTSLLEGTISNARIAIGTTAALGGSWVRSTLVSLENRQCIVFHMTAASAAFTEDETITGTTSGATAVVRTVDTLGHVLVCDTIVGSFSCDANKVATETITGTDSGSTATLKQIERITLLDNTLHLYFVTNTQIATVFYVTNVQAEIQPMVTTYCDGDMGHGTFWDGTAHASTSRRWQGMSSIRSMRLHATRDCYIAYDRTASNDTTVNAEDRGEYIRAGTDFGENHPIYLDDKISFINVLSGEQPRLYGRVDGV